MPKVTKLLGGQPVIVDTDKLRRGSYPAVLSDGKATTIPRPVFDLLPDPPGRPPLPPGKRLERRWLSMPPDYWQAVDDCPGHHRLVIQRAVADLLGLNPDDIR